ncbi:hypothetical protein RZS08_43240, partial [Arthrospira platensis SPKY1]|nr:hypothetical protein [Arthrospira platensis SPKY1]
GEARRRGRADRGARAGRGQRRHERHRRHRQRAGRQARRGAQRAAGGRGHRLGARCPGCRQRRRKPLETREGQPARDLEPGTIAGHAAGQRCQRHRLGVELLTREQHQVAGLFHPRTG